MTAVRYLPNREVTERSITSQRGRNHTPGRGQSMPIQSRNVDQKTLETEFLIAICRQCDYF